MNSAKTLHVQNGSDTDVQFFRTAIFSDRQVGGPLQRQLPASQCPEPKRAHHAWMSALERDDTPRGSQVGMRICNVGLGVGPQPGDVPL
jgi:hypothetical protein